MSEEQPQEGDLQVWWKPQVPMQSFIVSVDSVQEARKLLSVLADYDQFQFDKRIKGDYCNTGGLSVFEDGEWLDWYSEDGYGIDELWKLDEITDEITAESVVRLQFLNHGDLEIKVNQLLDTIIAVCHAGSGGSMKKAVYEGWDITAWVNNEFRRQYAIYIKT